MIRSFRYLVTFAFLGSLALPPFVALSTVASGVAPLPAGAAGKMELYGVVAVGACVGFYLLLLKIEPDWLKESQQQVAFLDAISTPFLSIAIVGSAALSLFMELAVIRWQGTIFEFFAFYKNYGLLACFAGLGLGYALSRSEDGIPLHLTLPLLAWQLGFLIALRYALPGHYSLDTVPFREQLNMGLGTAKPIQIAVIYLLLSVVFVLTALAFVPIGQLCGKLMERSVQLRAYGLNLLGSTLGVCAMFLVSFLWTGPVVWFGLCCLAVVLFLPRTPRSLITCASFTMLVTVVLAWPVSPVWNRLYSPYQLLEIGYSDTGLMLIRASGHYYQRVHNLSDAALQTATDDKLRQTRNYYGLPYKIHPGQNDVAVVGAGTGNDVAAALRSGARHVDAIEIDPAILLAGKLNHPEKPYDDPRVQAEVNDARSFFRNTSNRYDLIVYGLLDSHTLLSHASSVRLDSFVYTIEGLREARSRLKDAGVLSLSFSIINNDLGAKIFQMMREAFDGKDPVCVSLLAGWWIARGGGLPSTTAGRIGTAAVLTCPLFFSGVVFSTLLSTQARISSVMSMNLMGAMLGGILEYNSMYFGFHFLYLLAIGLYAAAWLSGMAFRSEAAVSELAEAH